MKNWHQWHQPICVCKKAEDLLQTKRVVPLVVPVGAIQRLNRFIYITYPYTHTYSRASGATGATSFRPQVAPTGTNELAPTGTKAAVSPGPFSLPISIVMFLSKLNSDQ